MSKKIAEDLDGLVLDVKVGSGAFMKTAEQAASLAQMMVGIGDSHDTPVTALLTDMSQPLGRAVGNANEIAESVDVLRGEGPEDVRSLTISFAAEMLMLAGDASVDSATARAVDAIETGAAFETMLELTVRQGGDPRVIEDNDRLPRAAHEYVLTTSRSGFVSRCDAYDIGVAAVRLGAGRATKEDDIDPAVGFLVEAKVGERVEVGDPLVRIAYNDETRLQAALDALDNAWEIADVPATPNELILGEIR
jgi:thymidine phosphorylase